MIRHVAITFAASLLVLVASSARADVAPFGGCSGGHHGPPLQCDAASYQGNTGRTCAECLDTDSTCATTLRNGGYEPVCTRSPQVSSDPSSTVYCKPAGTASRTGPGGTIPLAGILMLGTVWASSRLGRRRKG